MADDDLRRTTITFNPPVRIGAATLSEVSMREPLIEDEIEVAARNKTGTPAEAEARLIARLIDQPAEAVIKMRSIPYRRLQQGLMTFSSIPWAGSSATSSSLPASPDGGAPTSDA
jgi:hypothetical protein